MQFLQNLRHYIMKKNTQDIYAPIPAKRSGLRRRRFQMLAMWYGTERAENEISAHTAMPKSISEVLDAELAGIRRPENGMVIRLRSEWSSVVGSMFARFCEPETLRNGILTLKVKHSALLVELKPSCDIICTKVNKILGENSCKEVRLKI